MNKNQSVLQQTADYVRILMVNDRTGHDWWHVWRVRQAARKIAFIEKADLFVVELAALLHDLDDWKLSDSSSDVPQKAAECMLSLSVHREIVAHVCEIIHDLSFKGKGVETPMRTIEGKVVQDADRIDAIGAIGIARAFSYGGAKGREMYNPAILPQEHESFEAYKSSNGTTINHFYEKLLHLSDRLNTDAARDIAAGRHQFLEQYLARFFAEWEGKD